jgi:hypothetical protein
LIGHAMEPVLAKRGVVISTSYNVDETNVFGLQDLVGDVERATQPAVELYFPVVADQYDRVVAANAGNKSSSSSSSPLVAILGLSIFWQDLIEGILPLGNDGLVAVFDNAGCNQTFTFQINGPNATYLGSGDRHHPAYDDHLVCSSSLSGLTGFSSVSQVYTGPPLNEDFCPYSLRLHPSKTMEKKFITSNPTIFAFVAVSICEFFPNVSIGIDHEKPRPVSNNLVVPVVFVFTVVFTSLVFLAYDAVIEKRQRKVMQTATRSSAIISSLFPSRVRNRLYEESGTAVPTTPTNTVSAGPEQREPMSQTSRMKSFMAKTQRSVEPINTGPIADLFESTTVLFADIKGFTKWYVRGPATIVQRGSHDNVFSFLTRSSSREPTAVFTLLEALYGAYDKLAEKWGVYKVS